MLIFVFINNGIIMNITNNMNFVGIDQNNGISGHLLAMIVQECNAITYSS